MLGVAQNLPLCWIFSPVELARRRLWTVQLMYAEKCRSWGPDQVECYCKKIRIIGIFFFLKVNPIQEDRILSN